MNTINTLSFIVALAITGALLIGVLFILIGVVQFVIYLITKQKTTAARKKIFKGIILLIITIIVYTVINMIATPFGFGSRTIDHIPTLQQEEIPN